MQDILDLQTVSTDSDVHDSARVSTISWSSPCPGWPSAFTWGNC